MADTTDYRSTTHMTSQMLYTDDTCASKSLCYFRDELRFEFMDLPVSMFDYYNLKTARYMARVGNILRRRMVITPKECITRYKLPFDKTGSGNENCTEFNRVLSILVERPYILEDDYFRLTNTRNKCCPKTTTKATAKGDITDITPETIGTGVDEYFCGGCDCRHTPYMKAILCPPDEAWFDEFEKVLHIHEPQEPQCYGSDSCDWPHFKYYINYSVVPKMDICYLPTEFYDEYRDILLMGTKAAILMIRGRKWTNVELGAQLWKAFLDMLKVETDRLDSYLHKVPDGGGLQGKHSMRFEPAM